MDYIISPKIQISKFHNGDEFLYTFNEHHEIVPIFLNKEYINAIKNLNSCIDTTIINNLYNSGYIVKKCDIDRKVIINNYKKSKTYLFAKAYSTRTPLECKIELTYRCNLKCKYCIMIDSKSEEMSIEKLKDTINQLRELGVIQLSLTGGEIFLREDINELVDYCARKGFILILQSNGILIDDKLINLLKNYKNILLKISFHSSNSKVFNEFTGRVNSFEETIKNLKNLKSRGIKFILIFNVTSENKNSYEETIKFFNENNYRYIINSDIYPSISSKEKNNLEFINTDDIFAKIVYSECASKNEIYYSSIKCDAAKMRLRIEPNGNVVPCGLIRKPLGNIQIDTLKDIWNNETSINFINSEVFKSRKECEKCEFLNTCSKCNAMYLYYSDWNIRKESYCKKAILISKYYEEKDNEKIITSKSSI